jgi:hypothetical protein
MYTAAEFGFGHVTGMRGMNGRRVRLSALSMIRADGVGPGQHHYLAIVDPETKRIKQVHFNAALCFHLQLPLCHSQEN